MSTKDQVDAGSAKIVELVQSISRKIIVHDREHGVNVLPPMEGLVLRSVHASPGITPSAVAAELGLTSGNMSAALRTLTSRGLVNKVPDPKDRRRVQLEVTEPALRNIRRIRQGWADLITPLIEDDPEALQGALVLLEKLDRLLVSSVPGSTGQHTGAEN